MRKRNKHDVRLLAYKLIIKMKFNISYLVSSDTSKTQSSIARRNGQFMPTLFLTMQSMVVVVVIIVSTLTSGCDKPGNRADEVPTRSGVITVHPNIITPAPEPRLSNAKPADSEGESWRRIQKLAETDIEAALKGIDEAYPVERRDEVRGILLMDYCTKHLDQLAAMSKRIGNEREKRSMISGVINAWKKSDPVKLANYAMKSLTGAEKNVALSAAISELAARRSYLQATGFIDSMPYSSDRLSAISDLARNWAREDLDHAIDWANGLGLEEDKKHALTQIIPLILDVKGVDATLTFVDGLESPELRRLGVARIAAKLGQAGDANRAIQWVAALPKELKGPASVELARSSSVKNIDQWTQYVFTLDDPYSRIESISILAKKQFSNDPEAAAKWATTLPADLQNAALSTITDKWYDTDSMQLSEWIAKLPAGSARDSALDSLARNLARSDFAAAMDIANKIGDQRRRTNIVNDLKHVQRR